MRPEKRALGASEQSSSGDRAPSKRAAGASEGKAEEEPVLCAAGQQDAAAEEPTPTRQEAVAEEPTTIALSTAIALEASEREAVSDGETVCEDEVKPDAAREIRTAVETMLYAKDDLDREASAAELMSGWATYMQMYGTNGMAAGGAARVTGAAAPSQDVGPAVEVLQAEMMAGRPPDIAMWVP